MTATNVLTVDLPGPLPDAWFSLAHQLYENDPHWIPEDREAFHLELSPQNPWFRGRSARAFLIPNKARVTAYFDPAIRLEGRLAGCFGDIVMGDDIPAGRAVLEEATLFLRSMGAESLVGPIHMSTHHDYRTLVSIEPGGLPFPGEPYNHISLNDTLERCGLSVVQRYQSQILNRDGMRAITARCQRAARRAEAQGYRVAVEPVADLLKLLPAFYEKNVEIFRTAYAWSPVPQATWVSSVARLLMRACPHTCALAYTHDDEVVGFVITTPHWGPLIVQSAEPRYRIEDLRFDQHAGLLGESKSLLLKTLGVSPQHREAGVAAQLIELALDRALPLYDHAICALMREDNKSRRFGEGVFEAERWYALYGRPLA